MAKKILQETAAEAVALHTQDAEMKEETPVVAPSEIVPAQEIDERAKEMLKVFNNYSELYVDKQGGVYPVGTQPELLQSAILYKNPFYKS